MPLPRRDDLISRDTRQTWRVHYEGFIQRASLLPSFRIGGRVQRRIVCTDSQNQDGGGKKKKKKKEKHRREGRTWKLVTRETIQNYNDGEKSTLKYFRGRWRPRVGRLPRRGGPLIKSAPASASTKGESSYALTAPSTPTQVASSPNTTSEAFFRGMKRNNKRQDGHLLAEFFCSHRARFPCDRYR